MQKIYFLLSLVLLSVPFCVFAQEDDVTINDLVGDEGNSLDIEIIADTNARNITLFPLDEKNFGVGFDIVNEWTKTQPGVRYALEVFASDKGGYLVDTVVYDDDISLAPGQSIHKELTYSLPESLPKGEYVMEIKLTSKKGMNLALAEVGVLEKAEQSGLYVDPSTCYLKIGEEKFGLMQGIDVAQDEQLNMVCESATNFSTEKQVVQVQVLTQERVATGTPISQVNLAQEEFGVGESKQVSYVISKPGKAQAYEGKVLFYMNDGASVSNSINFRYIVQGISATVQNATTDKTYYADGDTAKVSLMISGIATAYPGARDQRLADDLIDPVDLFLSASLIDVNGVACSDKSIEKLDGFAQNVQLNIPVNKECKNPTVIAQVKDVNELILDDVNFVVETDAIDENAAALGSENKMDIAKKVAIFIAIIPLIILVLYFIFRKKKIDINIFFLSILLCGGLLFLSTQNVDAASFSTGKYHCFTLNGVKGYCVVNGTYDVGPNQKVCQDVIASASMSWSACSNITLDAQLFINGSRVWRDTSKSSDYAKTIWASNSSGLKKKNLGRYSLGNHNVNYKMTFYHDWHDWNFNRKTEVITASKSFNVTSCAVNGSCGTRHTKTGEWTAADLGRYTLCSSGTFAWVSALNDPTVGRWEWKCNGSGGGNASGTCWAKPPTVNGACSVGKITNPIPWNQTAWKSTSATHFCALGTPSPTTPLYPGYGESTSWTCVGSGPNHTDAPCSAERENPPACTCDSGVNGKEFPYTQSNWPVGTNFCTYGTASPISPAFPQNYGGSVSWTCSTPDCTGVADNCSASRSNPQSCECGTGNQKTLDNTPSGSVACKVGDIANMNIVSTGWTWNCGTDYNIQDSPAGADNGRCVDQKSCSANCVGIDIDAPTSIYLKKNGNKIDVKIRIDNNQKVLSGACSIKLNGGQEQTIDAVTETVHGNSTRTIHFDYPESGATIDVSCDLEVDCDGDGTGAQVTITDSQQVQSICMQKACNAQGSCQSMPVNATTYNDPACTSTCNSDADCSRGRMIETRP